MHIRWMPSPIHYPFGFETAFGPRSRRELFLRLQEMSAAVQLPVASENSPTKTDLPAEKVKGGPSSREEAVLL